MNMLVFRTSMIVFMILGILFAGFALYMHIVWEGLAILSTGIFGIIFFSYRLGKYWDRDDDKPKLEKVE